MKQFAVSLLVELLSVEQPQVEAVLHLVHMPHRGGHEAACGVPLNVCAHEVLCCAHGLEVISIEELELPIHALRACITSIRAGWVCMQHKAWRSIPRPPWAPPAAPTTQTHLTMHMQHHMHQSRLSCMHDTGLESSSQTHPLPPPPLLQLYPFPHHTASPDDG